MARYALLVEYDGGPFHGWQRQADGLPSVQAVLEAAAGPLCGGATPLIQASGRTDAGVHAEGQVAQLDLPQPYPPERVREALNFHSRPHPVSVLAAAAMPEAWSARFSCIGRAYRYRILNRRPRPALELGRAWHVPQPLDAEAMHGAAQALLGRHDFSAFRASTCQARDALRTLDRLDVARAGDRVEFLVEARSFLHHQVRNLVGTLVLVGQGRRPATWPRQVLDRCDRRLAGQTAPPEGLTFLAARYPEAPGWR